MTVERIAVGVDGSPVATSALRWASGIAASTGAEVLAVNAYQNPYIEVRPEEHNRLIGEREQALTGVWLAPAFAAGVAAKGLVEPGDPRDVLMSVAHAEAADLLVLGRTGAGGGPGFLHLGSVVEHAAHHTTLPLAVIPDGSVTSIGTIALGVDGSSESLGAVEWMGELAPALGASVVAIHVDETTEKSSRADIERMVATWTEPLTELGVAVEPVVQRDLHPADALLGVAAARGGDLLVIGARGLGGFTGLRAGGVALKVLHRARLPLVMIPIT